MRLLFLGVSLSFLFSLPLMAGNGSCPRCELLREYHDEHPEENYYWYDDYLEKSGEKNEYQPKNEPQASKVKQDKENIADKKN